MEKELIYKWNEAVFKKDSGILLHDETLREGMQSIGLDITLQEKEKYIDSVKELPVSSICLGFPSSSQIVYSEVEQLIQYMIKNQIDIMSCCSSRTMIPDIIPIVNLSQKYGVPIKVNAFIGTSQIRRYVEKWNVRSMTKQIEDVISFTDKYNLPVCLITEDTTRTAPEILKEIYGAALQKGCSDICFCDTVGYADYTGIKRLMEFTQNEIKKSSSGCTIEWHGHNDRGMALLNALLAAQYGADVIHVTGFGIGERCGNTPLELFLLNYIIMNSCQDEEILAKLKSYCIKVSDILHISIPDNYPVWGANAFQTVSGVHAAAIYKAYSNKNSRLAEQVYSFIAPSKVGRTIKIGINYMSGKSNVVYWLEKHNIQPEEGIVNKILKKAKRSLVPLTSEEIWSIIQEK